MEKIEKYWINLVRKEIPKHHKTFINFHRRQLTDAKRFAETCQREVSTAEAFMLIFFYSILDLIRTNLCVILHVILQISTASCHLDILT